jgi:hypothetical protein
MKSIKIKNLTFFSLWKLFMVTTLIPLCLVILFILFVLVINLLDSSPEKLGFSGAISSIVIMTMVIPFSFFIHSVIGAAFVKSGLWLYGKFFSAIEIEYDDGSPDLNNREA